VSLKIRIEVLRGVDGPALYIDNTRVAGPKAWGGTQGELAHWTVEVERFRQDVEDALP